MSLNISSKQIANPLLVSLLAKLSETFECIGSEFYVIGATARDILIRILAQSPDQRRTRDLDIAIAVPDWNRYGEIQEWLVCSGFRKSKYYRQRFYYGEYEVDVVPFGAIVKDDYIIWPPDEDIAMSVKGFNEALDRPINVCIDDSFDIKVVSLQGLFVLKLNAWLDRNLQSNKDAEDLWCIIDNYYYANEHRGIYPEVYDIENFDLSVAGAYWLAKDLCQILAKDTINYFRNVIMAEIENDGGGRLVMQMVETGRGLYPADVIRSLRIIAGVFSAFVDA